MADVQIFNIDGVNKQKTVNNHNRAQRKNKTIYYIWP